VSAPQYEERTAEFIEMRAAADGDGRTLEGYAAVFDTPTRISGWEGEFDESISRGAFRKTLSEGMPVLQFDHGHDARTGSVPIGTIEVLREDAKGLYVRARLFDNPVVEPIRQAIEGGAINGMSFRFQVVRDSWSEPSDKDRSKGAVPTRTVKEVRLFELGPVVFPAYPTTSVGVRDQQPDQWGLDPTRLEHALARYGLTLADYEATSDDAARTSPDGDAAGTSEDAGSPDPKRVALSTVRLRALELRGVLS
jgi:HK97 family phage prohead protease